MQRETLSLPPMQCAMLAGGSGPRSAWPNNSRSMSFTNEVGLPCSISSGSPSILRLNFRLWFWSNWAFCFNKETSVAAFYSRAAALTALFQPHSLQLLVNRLYQGKMLLLAGSCSIRPLWALDYFPALSLFLRALLFS